jgi:hypothetical protein
MSFNACLSGNFILKIRQAGKTGYPVDAKDYFTGRKKTCSLPLRYCPNPSGNQGFLQIAPPSMRRVNG